MWRQDQKTFLPTSVSDVHKNGGILIVYNGILSNKMVNTNWIIIIYE